MAIKKVTPGKSAAPKASKGMPMAKPATKMTAAPVRKGAARGK